MPARTRRQKKKDDLLQTGVIRSITKRRYITWNMQGGSDDNRKTIRLRRMMQDRNLHAILLQECGDLFNWVNDNLEPGWRIAVHRRWDRGGPNRNQRCSLAILTYGDPMGITEIAPPGNTQRPVIGAQMPEGWIYSVHAPSGGNPGYVQHVLNGVVAQSGGNYLLGGDFNLSPSVVPMPNNGELLSTGYVTHPGSGHQLDYGISETQQQGQWETTLMNEVNESDHHAVMFTFTT